MLPEIDVEDFERLGPHGAEETQDGRPGVHALDERAEADGVGPPGEFFHLRGERDVVPGHVFQDVVGRDAAVVQCHLDGSRRLVRHGKQAVKALGSDQVEDFAPQRIIPDGADGPALFSEAAGMVGKIGRGAAEGLPRREHVPKDLTDPHDYSFHALASFFKR